MPSTNKTPVLALSNYVEDDKLDWSDRNSDNIKVDDFAKETVAALGTLKENKVTMPQTIKDGTDFNEIKTPGMYFNNNHDFVFQNSPFPASTYSLLVEKTGAYSVGVKQTATHYYTLRTVFRTSNVDATGKWTEWTPIATATPPQEYPLPINLTIGHPTDAKNKYRKNAFEETTIFASIASVGNAFTDGPIILAALPDDVKPSDYIRTPAVIFKTSGTISSGFVVAQPNGEIVTAVTPDTNRIEFQMML